MSPTERQTASHQNVTGCHSSCDVCGHVFLFSGGQKETSPFQLISGKAQGKKGGGG